ncbi:hypothetical protein AB0A74_24800 [Saccharothrix sp. NPDC042600]|uniref:hypothetical protein n=1 Tax=Saccharothrix TaxID=2071 RepID=UPI0033E84513|nr:hypothetical protein GCM10017745_17960 [Saccharothrix mutabilis subsp. capreolus]
MSTWQEERRANRVAEAAIRRADRDAEAERRRADRAAQVQLREEVAQAARDRREAAVKAVAGWVRAHTLDLLFVPVILVPAVLAWTAMAAYGREVFGPAGVLLPLFSEGAMWTFAFAVPMAQRAGRATGWLHLGVWVFAAVAAVLNYVHGETVAHGVVMALVSVGGVVVHQLITASPLGRRPTRAERDHERLQRLAARRVVAVRRAAVRQAAAALAADGTATLVHAPGVVRLRRRVLGRSRLVPAVVAGLPVAGAGDTLAEQMAAEIGEYLSALPAPRPAADAAGDRSGQGSEIGARPAGTAETGTALTDPKITRYVARVRAAIDGERLAAAPSRKQVQRFLRCRAEDAAAVHRVLFPAHPDNGPDDDGPREEVTA